MPERPPKAWFDRCVESVSIDPAVTDPQAVCAWNWYYHMSSARRREILRGEVFDPELDLDPETYIYDPKIKRKVKGIFHGSITLPYGHLKRKWHKLVKAIGKPRIVTESKDIPLKDTSKVTLTIIGETEYKKAIDILRER